MMSSSVKYTEKTMVVMSNVRQQDKLNDFTNEIPNGFLNDFDSHQAAVMGIGLHSKFKNNATPVNTAVPSMITTFIKNFISNGFRSPASVTEPLDLSMFPLADRFYLDQHASYTPLQLYDHLNQTNLSYMYHLDADVKG